MQSVAESRNESLVKERKLPRQNLRFGLMSLLVMICRSTNASSLPPALENVKVTEKLGQSIHLKSAFKDENGIPVPLEKYFKPGKPMLLAMIYFKCPSLCNNVQKGLLKSLRKLDWTVGNQFEALTISINPDESPELATAKKMASLRSYGHPEAESGWHFLTGAKDTIQLLADELGFGFYYDPKEKEYAHSAVLFVLTPEGKISRYLYGIEFDPRDLKLALLEASSGKIGSVIDRFLLFCYRYDPDTRKYSIYLTQLMQLGGIVTIIMLGAYLFSFWRRQWHRKSKGA